MSEDYPDAAGHVPHIEEVDMFDQVGWSASSVTHVDALLVAALFAAERHSEGSRIEWFWH